MSFIYGIINFDMKPVQENDLQILGQAVKLEGFTEHTEIEDYVGFGFCTHPNRSKKTGIFKNKDLIVLADIRIYNEEKLKENINFNSPQEAFANAYQCWGLQCAKHINGDYACVIFDCKRNEVHLFRDHIGSRTLTYWVSGTRLIFASHEFGIAKSGLIVTKLCEEKLIHRFFRIKNSYEQTIFENIFKVAPGHYVSCQRLQQISKKYWIPGEIQQNKTMSFVDAVTQLRKLLITATINRMEPKKTGVHVSGGIDSTGIACILADYAPNKSQLIGYSWTPKVFDDPVDGINEKDFIYAFSEDKKVTVKYLSQLANETIKDSLIPEFETQYIEHSVMKMAKNDNVESIFSGWGGDEFVSLSTRGTINHLFFRMKWQAIIKYAKIKGIKSTIKQFRSDVLPIIIPFRLLPNYNANYFPWSKVRMLKLSFIRKNWKLIFFHSRKSTFGYGDRTKFMLNLLGNNHIAERLDSWTFFAERYGLEYKYPLLDKDLLEFWFSVPIEYTYKNFQSRFLFREAMKGILTEEVRTREDKGEAIRMAYALQELMNGKNYLKELYYSLSKQDHLPFFKQEALHKIIDHPHYTKPIKNWIEINKLTFYLRYVNLVKKYFPSQNVANNQSTQNLR